MVLNLNRCEFVTGPRCQKVSDLRCDDIDSVQILVFRLLKTNRRSAILDEFKHAAAVLTDRREIPKLGWTVDELAHSLSVSVPFLRLELKRGRLKAARLGRRVVVLDAEVRRYLALRSSANRPRPIQRPSPEKQSELGGASLNLRSTVFTKRERPLFAAAANDWLATKTNLRPNSVRSLRLYIAKLSRHFGRRLISDITTRM